MSRWRVWESRGTRPTRPLLEPAYAAEAEFWWSLPLRASIGLRVFGLSGYWTTGRCERSVEVTARLHDGPFLGQIPDVCTVVAFCGAVILYSHAAVAHLLNC